MKLKNIALSALLLLMASAFVACDEWLDEDPSKSTKKTFRTADQLDAILGYYYQFMDDGEKTALLGTDDFHIAPEFQDNKAASWGIISLDRILWSTENENGRSETWQKNYTKIYYANLVLHYIDEVSGDAAYKANLKAEAHFLRAYSMFEIALVYTPYYDGSNGNELGLSLKRTISFEESIARASLADSWAFIDADLQEALKITAPYVSNGKRRNWRATTAAVHAFAAHYYLYRGDLKSAYDHADAALKEYSTLKDFNDPTQMRHYERPMQKTINTAENLGPGNTKEELNIWYPYTYTQSDTELNLFEWEDVLYARTTGYPSWDLIPSPGLLDTYKTDIKDGDPQNDLRYKYFMLEDATVLRGYYDGSLDGKPAFRYPVYKVFYESDIIAGLTVGEMILIKAEVQARQGDHTAAMNTLDPLRRARIATAAYTPLTATDKADAIKKILQERRREMPFSIRWYDMKRLNANDDPSDDITVTRTFYPFNKNTVLTNDPVKTYTLEPGSRLYAVPLPRTELEKAKGQLQQNTY
ncbi:RagB/SusD family nutrient uptake outer membrane protein [Alistipes sp.]|uniref:RagB/SusD family nutrient uptake outer membrane protein n=1 Tax=Alistipes sp. TaxID=1872444 RepID=UPI003AF15E4E